ncbi:HAD-IA family hydrolase [Actinoplanes sp. NPDC026619]|uniref:HAD-IA family hydrolase n=1 Tax=Actinoplanes sp. NPDC026619 TaxID=3155798 RepID=UPI0033C6F0AE
MAETRRLVADLGGVAFHFDHAHRLARLAARCGLPAERIDALLWKSGFSAACDEGRYGSAAEMRAAIRAILDFPGRDADLDDDWCSAFRPDRAVIALLGDAALFTNNGPLEEEALPRLHPAAFERFEPLFFSYRLGCRKPDPAAFAAMSARLGSPPIVFVDDSAANVTAAKTAGWHAVRYLGLAGLRRDLQEAGFAR